jgi:hypothetical protein
MARVGILTFLHNDNYGSSLQAYALQRTVRDLGHDCEHLDYQPDGTEKIRNLLSSGNSMKLILDGIRKRSVKAGRQGARDKSAAIQAFYQKTMRLSRPCRNQAELKAAAAHDDFLICGSDQIWNPVWLNPAYFGIFAPKSVRRISYAPSLGIRTLPAAGKIRRIRRWIRDFSAVSVREEEGAELLEKMTGVRPDVLPDPVCLLRREEWEAVAAPLPEGEPYLLCYFIGENANYRERVRQISREKSLRVLEIPVTAEGYSSGFERLEGVGPEVFLGAVRGAACFCTDSFHGLVFGTLLGVQTEPMRRYREDDPESKNSRVDNFLRLIGEKGTEDLKARGREWLECKLQER